MVDRDGKKPFTIPKTHTSTKDVLFSEKPDSRNVSELFHEIKSCALEAHFDFRQNECKSCDTIRNPKLQKLFNERRLQMKRSHEPAERLAFHIISSRDIAVQIANGGLTCEQTVPSITKYLGNPTDGIHLSRRPDVLLASTGSRGLHTFGLLICKILLSKGYATVPAANNKELPAQLHYDHHFCKIQTFNKKQRQIDDLLANSLIFCYEHNDMQTLSHPSQVLPLAILWYDLTDKFSSELIPTPKESQQRVAKPLQRINSAKPKRTLLPTPDDPPLPMNNGSWEKPAQDLSTQLTIQTTPPNYPGHCMIPYPSLYTPFSSLQPSSTSRDPRITRTTTVAETIPLSPQNSLVHQSSSFAKLFSGEKSIILKDIPLAAVISLTDPRLPTLKRMHNVCYLESKAVKHAVQQQKRLNHYYDAQNGSTSKKTSYTPIPFVVRSITADEYERQNQMTRNSPQKDYASLYVSVVDCFQFGLKKADERSYIDLEQNENRVALDQIEISDGLIEHEKQLNLQERRLRLREQRQRKLQEHLNERKKLELANSKVYINNGRKLLRERLTVTTTNSRISPELLDFFSSEYRQENRPQVKRILAELLGVFIEKYGLEPKQIISNGIEVPNSNNQTNGLVVDMDIDSPSSQILSDHDERFPMQSSAAIKSTSSSLLTSVSLPEVSSHQARDLTIKNIQPARMELPLADSRRPTDDPSSKQAVREIQVSDNEIRANNGVIVHSITSSESTSNASQSRDEFVKLLTKEACISKPSSPLVTFHDHSGSEDDDDTTDTTNKQLSSTRTVTIITSNYQDNLISQATHVEQEPEAPTIKRVKVDSVSSVIDDTNSRQVITDDHDYRHDYDERNTIENRHANASRSRSKSTSSHSSSVRDSATRSPSTTSRKSFTTSRFTPRQRREQYTHDHQRSFERSIHYQQRNVSYTTAPTAQSIHHQKFNYNHQSVTEHPRFATVSTIPSLMETFNQGLSQISSNCDYQKPSPMADGNRNCLPSYQDGMPFNQQYYQDNYDSSLAQQPPPLMSTAPTMDFSHSYDSKPSNTIERLQMFLQDRSGAQQNVQPSSQSDYVSSSHMINAHYDGNNAQRFPNVNTNAYKQNPPTFSYTDAEQLLTFVQHFRQ